MQRKSTFFILLATAAMMSSGVWAGGHIMTTKPENKKLKLKTWTVIGYKYQLQCCTNLTSGVWQDLGEEFTADETSTNLTVNAESSSCWFRVVEKKTALSGPTSPPTPPPSEFRRPPSSPPTQ